MWLIGILFTGIRLPKNKTDTNIAISILRSKKEFLFPLILLIMKQKIFLLDRNNKKISREKEKILPVITRRSCFDKKKMFVVRLIIDHNMLKEIMKAPKETTRLYLFL
jgi:hypothetical protein